MGEMQEEDWEDGLFGYKGAVFSLFLFFFIDLLMFFRLQSD
jgi:hypothetical protein